VITQQDYLIGYGVLGDFGCFPAVTPLACRRGEPVVVRSPRGVELGTVLGPAGPGHAAYLANRATGQLLRLATPADLANADERRRQGHCFVAEARRLAADLGLPVEVLDVEILLDGEHAVVHLVHWDDFDPRPFVSTLSRTHAVHIALEDLTRSAAHAESAQGCGRPGCGQASGGCASEGGCGTSHGCASCGLKGAVDLKAYFAKLRRQMEERAVSPSPR
jgi:cell fate regulator YaaT (PSP1 superfamily)